MHKKILVLLLSAALLLIALSACDSASEAPPESSEIPDPSDSTMTPLGDISDVTNDLSSGEAESETEASTWEGDVYFDYSQTHKPTAADILTLTDGMPIGEVFERIGKPHKKGPYSGPDSLLWYTQEGDTCCILVLVPEDVPEELRPINTFEKLMQCGVAFNIDFPFYTKPPANDSVIDSYDHLYDRDRLHKPSKSEAQSITKGMTYAEVVDRLGKPHADDRFQSIPSHKWYMQEGGTIVVLFESCDESSSDFPTTMEDLIKYGVVYGTMFRVFPIVTDATTEEPSDPTEATTIPEPEPIPEPETIPVDEW